MSREKLTGRVTRIERSGFGVVQLDNGKEGFFDRFALRASQGGRSVRQGSCIIGEAARTDTDIVRLTSVGLASR